MFSAKRKWTILSIIVIIPLGLSTKIYSGILSQWVNNSLGGVFYVIFWSLVLSLFFPDSKPVKTATVIFLLTCIVEFMQLYHHVYLVYLRSNFIGRTILGTSFAWLDFFHYFIGFILAILLLKFLRRLEFKNK